jgi:hypothetical protein
MHSFGEDYEMGIELIDEMTPPVWRLRESAELTNEVDTVFESGRPDPVSRRHKERPRAPLLCTESEILPMARK